MNIKILTRENRVDTPRKLLLTDIQSIVQVNIILSVLMHVYNFVNSPFAI